MDAWQVLVMAHANVLRSLDPQKQRQRPAGFSRFIVLLGLCAATLAQAQTGGVASPPPAVSFIKGGNVSAWNITDVDRIFTDAQRLGLDTITVPVRMNMTAANGRDVTIDMASLDFARKVVSANPAYRYIIEPYPWIANGNVPETELDPQDKAAWFASWQASVVVLGMQFPNVWGIYIASNLVKLEGDSEAWISLVGRLRTVYRGKIIYRTQWWATASWAPETLAAYRAKLANPLFGAVDVIAIAAYFEVSEAFNPSLADIKAALRATTVYGRKQDIYAEVMGLNAKWHKPIFFGELSCPALDFGAQNPWDPAVSETPNAAIQKNLLRGYLETFPQNPQQFLGFSLFTIGHPTATTYQLAPSAAEYVRAFKPQNL